MPGIRCVRPPDFFRSTLLRLALFYLGVFIISSVALAVFVSWSSSLMIERQVQDAVDLEAGGLSVRYRDRGISGLADLIAERMRQDNGRQSVYLLLGPDGGRLQGNLTAWPAEQIEPDGWVRFTGQRSDGQLPAEAVARAYSLPEGYDVLVGRVLTDATQLNQAIRRALGWGLGLTIVLGGLGALITARHLVRRVDAMSRTAHSIIRGELKSRMILSGSGDEFDRLALSFNAMMDEIEHLVESIRSVSDNIAHDLRTPLNRLRSRIDVALLSHSSVEDYKELLAATLQDADHLLGTFNALLAISRAESGERLHHFTALDPALLLADVAELYEPLCEERGLDFQAELTPGLQANGNREFIAQALANVLDNAVKYTPAGGAVMLRVRRRSSGETEFSVTDTGPGVADQDRQRVVQRFVRLENSRNQPGAGLGLSLVAAVAEAHGGRLELDEGPGKVGTLGPGLRVAVILPRAA